MATSSKSWDGGTQSDEEMPEFLRIPPSDIEIGVQIGRGGFSTVHKASWRGKPCAAKIVQTENVRAIQKEVSILSQLSHPHVVGCVGFSVDSVGDPSRCMILMELMERDLRDLMNERLTNQTRPFSEDEAVSILCQIASGMAYLHSRGVFHGDLKASNVLVSHSGDGKLVVKITDFGVSQMVKRDPGEKSEEFIKKKHFRGAVGTRAYQAPEVSSSSVLMTLLGRGRGVLSVGTSQFRAPEVYSPNADHFWQSTWQSISMFRERKSKIIERNLRSVEFYSAKADVYCFAMTCYEVLSGLVPFESIRNQDIPELVLGGARPELPGGLDLRWRILVRNCWHQKPSSRPRFSDIKHYLDAWEQSAPEQRSNFRSSERGASGDQSSHERVSKDQSRKKTPKCWGRLLTRSRRGKWE